MKEAEPGKQDTNCCDIIDKNKRKEGREVGRNGRRDRGKEGGRKKGKEGRVKRRKGKR